MQFTRYGFATAVAMASFVVFMVLIRKPADRDTMDYDSVPPWPVLSIVMWLSKALRDTADALTPPAIRILDLTFEVNHGMSIYACSKAGWPEFLDRGPRSAAELAAHANITKRMASRLLRACTSWDMFRELTAGVSTIRDEERKYVNRPLGDVLRGDHPYSMKSWIGTFAEEWAPGSLRLWDGVKDEKILPFSVAFNYSHEPHSLWRYYAAHPQQQEQFNRAMTSVDSFSLGTLMYDFDWAGKCTTIVDIGGGRGSLLAALLSRAPQANGVLFDLPSVVAHSQGLWQSKYQDRLSRTAFIGGSFLEADAIPKSTGDSFCYVSRGILHDWDDESALQIVRNVVAAMQPGSRYIIMEAVPDVSETMTARTMLDLQMLVIGGVERTLPEFEELFRRTGLRLEGLHPTRSLLKIVEAVKP